MKKKGFSLIEIIIALSIISVLVVISASAYYGLQKGSRDTKRRADLDTIRGALELYRTNNSRYPKDIYKLVGEKKYLQSLPKDPFDNKDYFYGYSVSPADCDDDTIICTDYILGAFLEKSTNPYCLMNACGSKSCNYCTGPYGED